MRHYIPLYSTAHPYAVLYTPIENIANLYSTVQLYAPIHPYAVLHTPVQYYTPQYSTLNPYTVL